jgi:S1-C subfamily serine protease
VPSPFIGLEVDEELRPSARAFAFDLHKRLSSVVALEARAHDDAFTAKALGVDRIGNAVVIGEEGLVLTIGYLVTEAEDVVLTLGDGRRVPAHVLGVDAATGFGLLHALEPLGLPALPIGDSRLLAPDEVLISAGGGGRTHSLAGHLLGRAPFSGYWEYHLDDALFVEPAHPHWSGAALINAQGELVGLGSLRVEQRDSNGAIRPLNMFVPAELLTPIRDELARGRQATPPRPWLGVFTQEVDEQIVVLDVSPDGPAARAEIRRGDVIREVDGKRVRDLASFYQGLWALGPPGVAAPLTLQRGGDIFQVEIRSADRAAKLKKPRLN